MKLDLAEFIVEALKESGGDEYDHPRLEEEYFYSGDEDPTAAVIMEQSLLAFASAVAVYSQFTGGDPTDEEIDLLREIAYLRWDSMGRGKIVLH